MCFKWYCDHTIPLNFIIPKTQHNIFSKSRFSKCFIAGILCCYDNKFENFLAALEIKTYFHKICKTLLNSCSKFHQFLSSFYDATRKWRGIMLYPPKFWVSVRPSVRLSVCLSVRPSVRPSVHPSVSAHHHSCIGNSSYSFRPILLKLYRCFKDGLKICILFFQNPEIIFYHFFPIFNLDIFRALILQICIWSMYLVSATPPTVFGESFWNFTGVLRMVWRYACCFFRILKLFFITFFAFLT